MELNNKNNKWENSELQEAILAYNKMLRMETNGEPYSKAAINKELTQTVLYSRNRSSIEFRMQNISYVLNYFNLPTIQGYKPAKNVGSSVFEKIKKILEDQNILDRTAYGPTSDNTILEIRTKKLINIDLHIVPEGSEHPNTTTVQTQIYERDPLVRSWILKNSNGNCESCGHPAPFKTIGNNPYLEVHHMKPLALGGSDKITNTIAICPNCHKRCHYSEDAADFTESIFRKIQRLKRE